MNAINLLQMASAPKSEVLLAKSGKSEERLQTSFLQILDHALSGEKTDSLIASLNEEEGFANLHELVKELVDMLDLSDIEMDEAILNKPPVKQFFEELPFELQLEIESDFENYKTLGYMIENNAQLGQLADLKAPAKLLTFLIVVSQSTNEVSPQAAVGELKNQLEKLLPMLFKEARQTGSTIGASPILQEPIAKQFEQLIQQLTTNLRSMSMKEKEELAYGIGRGKQSYKGEQIILSAITRVSPEQTSTTQSIHLPLGQATQLSPVQQLVIHVGQQNSEKQTPEQFLRQFQNILGKSSLVQFPNGSNQLTIKLFPEHLGRLDVKLTQENGVIVAQLMTTTQAAKKLIESQLYQLKQAFVGQNIQVEKIDINIQQQQQPLLNQSNKENQDNHHRDDDPNSSSENEENDDEVRFEDFLEQTFNTKV